MQLNSKNKSILVVSDIHQDVHKLQQIIKAEDADEVVCLGDWFDSFYRDDNEHVEAACDFIKKWINKPNFHTLIGNHDVQYLYANRYSICSGYEQRKKNLITKSFGNFIGNIREKFGWYIWIDDFLCTHSGVSPSYFPPSQEINKEAVSKWLDSHVEAAEAALINGNHHWLFMAGAARGGRQNYGGITWLDFNREFEPIEGIKQIVGHTSGKVVRAHESFGGLNPSEADDICIDCHLNEYLVIRNGKITVKKFIDI